METIKNTVIGALESVKDTIEKRDEDVKNRQPVFAQAEREQAAGDARPAEAAQAVEGAEGQAEAEEVPMEKLKQISLELLDIGLYYGEQGIGKVKTLPLYQKADAIVKFDDKFAVVREHGKNLYTYLDGKIRPIVQNVFFVYEQATSTVTSYIRVITEKHAQIQDYVKQTYTTVSVTIQGTWIRLDFDHDGSVSIDDMKKSMFGLYDFLKNFDVIEKSTQVKS